MLIDNLIKASLSISVYSIKHVENICSSAVMVGVYDALINEPQNPSIYEKYNDFKRDDEFLILRGKKPTLASSFSESPSYGSVFGPNVHVPKANQGKENPLPSDTEALANGGYNPSINSNYMGLASPTIPAPVRSSKLISSQKTTASPATAKRSAAEGDHSLQSTT